MRKHCSTCARGECPTRRRGLCSRMRSPANYWISSSPSRFAPTWKRWSPAGSRRTATGRGHTPVTSDLAGRYQEVIIGHGRHPHNFRKLEDPTRTARGVNPLCGNQLTVHPELTDGRITDIALRGSGGSRAARSHGTHFEAPSTVTVPRGPGSSRG